MTAPPPHKSLVLGLHPTARGFGWAAFSDPFTVHSHGVYSSGKDKHVGILAESGRLFRRLKPEVLVLEAFDAESSQRSKRIRKLCLQIVNLAADRNLEVQVYRKGDVLDAFRTVGARSRHEIAEAVARHVGGLSHYLPGARKEWVGEDRRMSRFCAAALVLTHYHAEATQLFDDLRKAA
jgi:hypothetical protein